MPESIEASTTLRASAERIYHAWLDSDEHGHFTGSPAEVDPVVGGQFCAWDGYISGVTLELEPHRRIVQAWRTTDFPPGSPDSRLEILLKQTGENTKVTLIHTNIPDGQGKDYEQGWIDYYFAPMQEYFAPEDVA
jgi:activator of HSP90 ATPase